MATWPAVIIVIYVVIYLAVVRTACREDSLHVVVSSHNEAHTKVLELAAAPSHLCHQSHAGDPVFCCHDAACAQVIFFCQLAKSSRASWCRVLSSHRYVQARCVCVWV